MWKKPITTFIVISAVLAFGMQVFAYFRINQISASAPLPAFPGAEGFGSQTEGGRGGKVLIVTNLNDTVDKNSSNYPGSLRWALEQPLSATATDPYGNRRIIVFAVGGKIQATAGLAVIYPYTTVAGQTAPGQGITIVGSELSTYAHDVVVRGIKIRAGDGPVGSSLDKRDGARISSGYYFADNRVYNVIYDHVSVSWALDENSSTWINTDSVYDITFSWSIFAEPIRCSANPDGCAGYNMLIGPGSKNISVHHNIFAHGAQRNPLIKQNTSLEFINNIVYNWEAKATHFINDQYDTGYNLPLFANLIGNKYISGPSTKVCGATTVGVPRRGIMIEPDMASGTKFYLKDNLGPNRSSATQDEWDAAMYSSIDCNAVPEAIKSTTPAFTPSNVKSDPAANLEQILYPAIGASTYRDTVDQAVINSIKNKTGKLINTPSESVSGGYPTYTSSVGKVDTDKDGMPDEWEATHGLNPNNYVDNKSDRDGDGYSNIEEYINSFFITASAPTCPTDFDKNGVTDANDFTVFSQNYKVSGINCNYDLTGNDCYLDTKDLSKFAQKYNSSCV